MMTPDGHLERRGDAAAVLMADSKETVTYLQLVERSRRLARVFAAHRLRPGDHIAVMLENHPRFFEVFWAAMRSGLYFTPINWHLNADEAGYIIEDCGASTFITSAAVADVARTLEPCLAGVDLRLVMDDDVDGFDRYEDALAAESPDPIEGEREGSFMFYSSGTTGRPKGIKPPLPNSRFGENPNGLAAMLQQMWGFGTDTVYLCPAPLYHAAPIGWSSSVQRLGGTVLVMERFDPERALALIEEHSVTHAQLVPTHFVRMLKLDESVRNTYDLSSLRIAVHAAAPCPVEVKEQMIGWWGPIIHEYYAGSEGNGFTAVGPEEWLDHKGTVGKPLIGALHILDDQGNEHPPGEPGQIWFESNVVFEYHNDADKTDKAFNDRGWSSLGDIGYVDDEGYLYLTDRVSHMIISGGVNIYPQEVENLLTMHPAVADVAVIGVPDADMGEQVKAVVQAAEPFEVGDALAGELIEYCRGRLATFKCPRSVDFVEELPRLPTGKLLKRELRARYWPA